MTRIGFITYNVILPSYQKTTYPLIAKAFEELSCSVEYIALDDLCLQHSSDGLSIFHKGDKVEPFDITIHFCRKADRWTNVAIEALTSPTGISLDDAEKFINKIDMMYRFSKNNIPHPHTHTFYSKKSALAFYENISGDIILKSSSGGQGNFVFLIQSKEECIKKLDYIFERHTSCLFQEVITPLGQDIRALVFKNKILGAYKRIAPESEFLSNISKGAKAESVTLTKEEQDNILKAAHIYNVSVLGVDLMRKQDGSHVILEVNEKPGIEGFYMLGKDMPLSIAQESLNYLEKLRACNP